MLNTDRLVGWNERNQMEMKAMPLLNFLEVLNPTLNRQQLRIEFPVKSYPKDLFNDFSTWCRSYKVEHEKWVCLTFKIENIYWEALTYLFKHY